MRLGFDDLVSHRVAYQLTDGVQLQLAHDVGAMCFRGLHADSQRHRHFLAALAFRQQLHDFALARGEPAAQNGHVVRNRILFAESIEQHVRCAGSEEGSMIAQRLDSGDEIFVGIRLHNVRAHSSFDDVANKLIGKVQRQYDNFRFGKALADAAGSFQAVQFRHADVHHHNIRFQLLRQCDCFAARLRLGAHFPAVMCRQELL
jgi:hypothetical protein